MEKFKILVVFSCLFTFFIGSAESQTTEKNLSKNERKAKVSEANPNGCGAVVTTSVDRKKPSDVASFIGYSFDFLSKKKKIIADKNCQPIITSFILSASEIILNCPINQTLSENHRRIEVSTEAFDIDNDPLTYLYYISGGKIVGQGSKVVWDLSGEKPGVYRITVGVNDVWELSETVTREVKIIECAGNK